VIVQCCFLPESVCLGIESFSLHIQNFFRAAFAGGFTESKTAELPLHFSDPANVLNEVIRSLYQGSITITFSNAIPVLVAAEQLQINVLKDLVQRHLSDKVDHWAALRYLAEASKYAEGAVLAETFAGTVAPYFHQVMETKRSLVLALPPDTFSMLVCHPDLAVREEGELYRSVVEYLGRDHDPPLASDRIMSLLKTVEFADLSSEDLAEAQQQPIVPQELVMEGMLHRIKLLESGTRLKKRRFAQHSREFIYQSNFDTNGIIYYLATNGHTDPYVNPMQLGAVRVSSGRMCYGDLASVVGRTGVDVWTDDDPAETWYAIDLGTQYRVRLTAYSLRRGGGASRARDWVLEGSNDEQDWVRILVHDDDRFLETEDDDYGAHTWSETGFETEFTSHAGVERAFRHFRIRMTKPAHDGDWYFAISGIELYGHLIEGQAGNV